MKKYYLFILLSCALVLKIVLMETKGDFERMNPDEERNYTIAQNFNAGKGYTINNKPTAFHPSLSVFIYRFIIRNNISKSTWIRFFHYMCIILFIVSAYYFYCFNKLIHGREGFALLSTLVYLIYPSNLIYIGNIYLLEKFVLPLLVINLYFIYKVLFKKYPLRLIQTIFLAISIALSCFLRHQLLIIYVFIFLFAGIYILFIKNSTFHYLSVKKISMITGFAIILLSIPVLNKNYELFHAYVLTTQTGVVLTHGHSDIAKGAFIGDTEHFDKYSKTLIPNLADLNEQEESLARTNHALGWVMNNPAKEIHLIFKKIALFFIPANFNSGINYFTAVIHLLFLLSIIFALSMIKSINKYEYLFILTPVIAALLLSIITFVGYRWRLYAEPFMLLSIMYIFYRKFYLSMPKLKNA